MLYEVITHPYPELLTEFTMSAVWEQVQELRQWLNYWAMNKAPESLRTNYRNNFV